MKKYILLSVCMLCGIYSYAQVVTTVIYDCVTENVFNSLIVNVGEGASYEVSQWAPQQIPVSTGITSISTAHRYIHGEGIACYTVTFEGLELSNININCFFTVSGTGRESNRIGITVIDRYAHSYQQIFRADVAAKGVSTPFATGVIFAITGGIY